MRVKLLTIAAVTLIVRPALVYTDVCYLSHLETMPHLIYSARDVFALPPVSTIPKMNCRVKFPHRVKEA